ncbi:MAG TPA: copper oxidase [Blastocatellia bacterium]|nr:copper oxidase [Blastocatellia bacterium]
MGQQNKKHSRLPGLGGLLTLVSMVALLAGTAAAQQPTCNATVKADVVAIDQVITYNRFGAFNPAGMLYALRRDVVPINASAGISAGNVQLRADKRPRPIVLRVNEGDCLQVTFTNLLNPNPPDNSDSNVSNDTTATRNASMHVNGLDYVGGIASDGANVGQNPSSLATPGQTRVYTWYAAKQGQYMLYSMGANAGGEGDAGQPGHGLFGSINVEPKNSKWYRSQTTGDKLQVATRKKADGTNDVNPNGTPKINYDTVEADGTPLLKMLNSTNEIVHTDLNAIITDDDGVLDEDCSTAPPSSTCGVPFREFTVLFHDEIKAIQAFPELDAELMHGARDGFAINYGSGAMGSIVVANRKGVGPAADCGECKFEEFFLESWANNDPAMVVRKDPETGKAVEALYPDDPSNVHHSYLGEAVRFRNIHIGAETHVFHLHAHQWLQTPRDQNSTYLDSQTISPGGSYTYEINYGGSGNRNFTIGDSIFHCHLYPHFAQGMWELWRVHDVFEAGTADRRLPDGEIAGGTPNPAVIPIPNATIKNNAGAAFALGLPPMPTADFKGFPFYIGVKPGDDLNVLAGNRAPQAPNDLERDGGLPRHRILNSTVVDGAAAIEPALLNDPVASRVLSQNGDPTLLAFARKLLTANIDILPLDGTAVEKKAIDFHAGIGGAPFTTQYDWTARAYPSYTATGAPGLFLVNGRPAKPGAPFADPCPDTFKLGGATRPVSTRNYRGAYIQFDMTVNQAGWHDRQARIITLEQDALPTLSGTRTPEPLFFRANSGECLTFAATNLIPHVLNLDDFQVFTPTDTIGQHIHLVKFDVTASDGAGNGWNYEDGTFSPGEVQERIEANNAFQQANGGTQILHPVANPVFGEGPDHDGNGVGDWLGAQTTIQRWWADPLLNKAGQDRTIRTVFTHDHFGPSSHQHHGFYGALVVEPSDSQWKTLDGSPLGGRMDGGPTTYAANIIPPNQANSYREFNIAFADFAIVYRPDLTPVNPPGRQEAALPIAIEPTPIPLPEIISAADPGTQLVNYRNEPIPLRIGQGSGSTFAQKTGAAGDMANVFDSKTHGDPFTPILRAYEGDRVQIRLIQGAQEEQHGFNMHGVKWLFEPGTPGQPTPNNSGWRNGQQIGISEHFEFVLDGVIGQNNNAPTKRVDYLYSSATVDNLWDGQWGFLRAFQGAQPGLAYLPNNPDGAAKSSKDVCPQGSPFREYFVEAWAARDLLPGGALVYNQRFNITDPNAVLFVESSDVAALQAGTRKPEPLILRAAAGDCINVTLRNKLPNVLPEQNSWNMVPMIVDGFNFNQVRASNRVSLHPQLVALNPQLDDGANVGFNEDTTIGPGQSFTYIWYAGDRKVNSQGKPVGVPIEFGATALRDMGDVIKHSSHGAVGQLIIEPVGSTWTTVGNSKATADVKNSAGTVLFREFSIQYQDDLSLRLNGQVLKNIVDTDDSEESGMKAFNYRTEPFWGRMDFPIDLPLEDQNNKDFSNVLSSTANNAGCGGACGDPETPVFTAKAGTPVRFRVTQSAGHPRQHAFTLFGHHWQQEPWQNGSSVLGSNPLTFEIGSESGITAMRHFNALTTAGGLTRTTGDFLYRTQETFSFSGGGLWGIFRVTP